MKRVGRLAFRSIVYFEIVTTIALAVGLLAVNLVKPGRGVDLGAASAKEGGEYAATHTTLTGVIEHTVPQSFFSPTPPRMRSSRSFSSRSSLPSRWAKRDRARARRSC